jgi:hypothetical protein
MRRRAKVRSAWAMCRPFSPRIRGDGYPGHPPKLVCGTLSAECKAVAERRRMLSIQGVRVFLCFDEVVGGVQVGEPQMLRGSLSTGDIAQIQRVRIALDRESGFG